MFGKQIFVFVLLLGIGLSLTLVSHYKVEHLQRQNINQLRQGELKRHNQLRARHGCPPLKLDNALNNAAQAYAQELYDTFTFQHSPETQDGKYGQNLAWRWGYPKLDYKAGNASQSWYDEKQYYDYSTFDTIEPQKQVGHFTAMIWKSAKKVGFGFAYGPENDGFAMYVVANYFPVTNVIGRYAENVPYPKY